MPQKSSMVRPEGPDSPQTSPSWKQRLKRILLRLPGGRPALERYAYYVERRRLASFPAPKDVFTHYYETNHWTSEESRSGVGSTAAYTESIRVSLPVLFEKLGIRTLLDAPCGDFNWFRLMRRPEGLSYVGGDIVDPLINDNQRRYGDPQTRFMTLDIVHDRLPRADLWLCRDCLFHFSYEDIFLTLHNFIRSDIPYLLTSTHSACTHNTDIPTGSFRSLNLELPPFNLGPASHYLEDWAGNHDVRHLGLWDRHSLVAALDSNPAFHRAVKPS